MGAGGSLVEQARKIGNDAFKNQDYPKAVEAYSRALDEEADVKLLCNRSIAYLHLHRPALAYIFILHIKLEKKLSMWSNPTWLNSVSGCWMRLKQ